MLTRNTDWQRMDFHVGSEGELQSGKGNHEMAMEVERAMSAYPQRTFCFALLLKGREKEGPFGTLRSLYSLETPEEE